MKTISNQFTKSELEKLSGIFPDINTFTLPSGIARDVSTLLRYKKNYSIISTDRTLAIEKCLYLISNLTSTIFQENKWKPLSSTILHTQMKESNDNTYTYKKILSFLIENNIIDIMTKDGKEIYQSGIKSKQYRLNPKYDTINTKVFLITSASIITKRNKRFYITLNDALNNPICNNLVNIYPSITLPTEREILKEAKRLIKSKHKTNKGKVLTIRNSKPKSFWESDKIKRSFVEDNIKLFNFLTSRGFMIPTAGTIKSGGRIVDSFTLMPSWIRKMITINGQRLTECDYSTLHPNIAKTIFGGSESNVSHDDVSNYLGIERSVAKIEHLSFFNKQWSDMERSPLFKYYIETELEMMKNIRKDKIRNSYKITSQRLFTVEVDVMTEVVKELNRMNINALYVYDALYVEPQFDNIAKEVMNKIAKINKINTTV